MKHKYRYFKLKATDQVNLETLLNTYAKAGWHFKRIFGWFVMFEYHPEIKRAYTVLIDYSQFRSLKHHHDKQEIEDKLEYLESFDYRVVYKRSIFIILSHPDASQYSTDEQIDETVSKPERLLVYKSEIFSSILDVVLQFWILLINPWAIIAGFLLSWVGVVLGLLFCYLIINTCIRCVNRIRIARDYYKHYRLTVKPEYTQIKHSQKELRVLIYHVMTGIVWFVIFISMMGDISPMSYLVGLLVLLMGLIAFLWIVATNSDESPKVKVYKYMIPIALLTIGVFYGFTIMNNPDINLDRPLTPLTDASQITSVHIDGLQAMIDEDKNCVFNQSASPFAGVVSVYCDAHNVRIFTSNYEGLMPIITKGAIGMFEVPEQKRLSISEFNQTAYRKGNVVLLSYGEIPHVLIESLSGE